MKKWILLLFLSSPVLASGPNISNVRLDWLTHSGVRVRWNNSVNILYAKIFFGQTSSYGTELDDFGQGGFANDTGMALSGLAPNTTYHYSIESSSDGVVYSTGTADATFTTLPLPAVHPVPPRIDQLWTPVFPATSTYISTTTALDCHDINVLIANAVSTQPFTGTVINIPNEVTASSACPPLAFPNDTQILQVTEDFTHISTNTGVFTATVIPPGFNLANGRSVILANPGALPGSATQGNDNNSFNPNTSNVMNGPLTSGVTYYIVGASSPNFQLAATPGGAAIIPGDFGNGGNLGGTMYMEQWPSQNQNWIVIQTSTTDNNFCPQGVRCMGSIWSSKMAKLIALGGNKNVNVGNTGFFTHNVWFRGIDLTQQDETALAQTSVDPEVSNNFFWAPYSWRSAYMVFDRSYIHCQPFPNRCDQVINQWGGSNMAMINSDLENWDEFRLTVSPTNLTTGGNHGIKGTTSGSNLVISTGTSRLGAINMCSMLTAPTTFTFTSTGVSGSGFVYVTSSCVMTIQIPTGDSATCSGVMVDSNSANHNCVVITSGTPQYLRDSSQGFNCLTVGQFNVGVSTVSGYIDQAPYSISNWFGEGTQGMQSGQGPGPLTYWNNYVEGTGIVWHIDDSSLVDSVGIWIRQNTFAWDQSKKDGSPTWDGFRYTYRNGPEAKHGRQIKADGNILSGSWADVSAAGPSMLFHTATNNGTVGTASNYAIQDVDITNNTCVNTATCFEFGGGVMDLSPTPPAQRIRVQNNLINQVNGYTQTDGFSGTAFEGGAFGYPIAVDGAVEDLIIDHNTIYNNMGLVPWVTHNSVNWIEGGQITNNILWFNVTNQGFSGEQNSGTVLTPPIGGTGYSFLNAQFTSDPNNSSLVSGGNLAVPFCVQASSITCTSALSAASVCTNFGGSYGTSCSGGFFNGMVLPNLSTATTLSSIGFTSVTANNFMLLYNSPYISSRSVTTDGTTLGVDMNKLLTAQGYVSTPTVTGITATSAVVSFFAYDGSIACPVDYATSPNDASTQTGGGRSPSTAKNSQSVTISGLTTKTNYNYRVLCPVYQLTGSFKTQ